MEGGVRSVRGVATRIPDGNILFDGWISLTQRGSIGRSNPGLAARIAIVTRAHNDYVVSSLVY